MASPPQNDPLLALIEKAGDRTPPGQFGHGAAHFGKMATEPLSPHEVPRRYEPLARLPVNICIKAIDLRLSRDIYADIAANPVKFKRYKGRLERALKDNDYNRPLNDVRVDYEPLVISLLKGNDRSDSQYNPGPLENTFTWEGKTRPEVKNLEHNPNAIYEMVFTYYRNQFEFLDGKEQLLFVCRKLQELCELERKTGDKSLLKFRLSDWPKYHKDGRETGSIRVNFNSMFKPLQYERASLQRSLWSLIGKMNRMWVRYPQLGTQFGLSPPPTSRVAVYEVNQIFIHQTSFSVGRELYPDAYIDCMKYLWARGMTPSDLRSKGYGFKPSGHNPLIRLPGAGPESDWGSSPEDLTAYVNPNWNPQWEYQFPDPDIDPMNIDVEEEEPEEDEESEEESEEESVLPDIEHPKRDFANPLFPDENNLNETGSDSEGQISQESQQIINDFETAIRISIDTNSSQYEKAKALVENVKRLNDPYYVDWRLSSFRSLFDLVGHSSVCQTLIAGEDPPMEFSQEEYKTSFFDDTDEDSEDEYENN